MRRALKVVLWALVAVAVLVVTAGIWFFTAFPRTEAAPDLTVEPSAELLARGRYLFHHVLSCAHCHSRHDETLSGGPIVPGTLGAGGLAFPLGRAGTLYSKNISPAVLGDWTDGEIVRALRDGVSRDGSALFPLMPYPSYRHLARRDLEAVVAYTRSLARRASEVPPRELRFPLRFLVRTMPSPAGPVPEAAPDPAAGAGYGEYLVQVASCGECHTPNERGRPIEGMTLAGGGEFSLGDDLVVRPANITPDEETGIGGWTKEMFVARFKSWGELVESPRPLAPGENPSPMPWLTFSGMTEEDLGAIYDYLRTVSPVRNEVVRFERMAAAE